MGLRESPFRAMQAIAWAKEFVYGDKNDLRNSFRWDKAVLNLPGSPDYDPCWPWVSKRREDDSLASEAYLYTGD